MVQATNFLLRWLFLCRLVDDRAEVQTWPYRRPGYYEHPAQSQHGHGVPPPPYNQQTQHGQQQQYYQQTSNPHSPQQQQPTPISSNQELLTQNTAIDIPTFRESIIRSLTSHPPGSTERLQKLDELRLQTVREFARRLVYADEVIRFGAQRGHYDDDDDDEGRHEQLKSNIGDHDLDKDESIQHDFQEFMQQEHKKQHKDKLWKRWSFMHESDADALQKNKASNNPFQDMNPQQIQQTITSAQQLLAETRSFLPQLVSTVLHSPPALLPDTHISPDPISSLRSLLIHRCQIDPSLGIELCWLLEAEVGRKWKALFEHRQQTGKRLILIVQADIAQAIATIGAEKASAFNLLQDAEMATAFGMERMYEASESGGENVYGGGGSLRSSSSATSAAGAASRPPRSISDLRCRHFGDSMHFVDRLTQISLDLRHVPPIHRRAVLQDRLRELNQRLCRRIVSRGRISIDVESLEEDGQYQQVNSYGQPISRWSEENVREDMIQHSVHLPMEPQSVHWAGGPSSRGSDHSSIQSDFEHPEERNGVVRVLRILPDRCRVLDSRERCPFLVRMEVAETGLDANDARLYASGVSGVSLTVEEALGSIRPYGNSILGDGVVVEGGFASCEIPPELMRERTGSQTDQQSAKNPASSYDKDNNRGTERKAVPRGGYQGTDEFYAPPGMYGDYNTYENVREHHYEQLHDELRQQRENEYYSPQYYDSMAGRYASTVLVF